MKQSAIALCWLQGVGEELHENGLELISKFSVEGEQRIMGHFVDDFCPETNTIYQFHGFFYHGCDKCYDGDAYNTVCHEKFYNLHERTRRITYLFITGGYRVVEKWECEYRRESDISLERIKQLSQSEFFTCLNLNPRDALFGGRTSPAGLFDEMKKYGGKIRYYDYTSLYPFVQKIYPYPTGHPQITRGVTTCENVNIAEVFGLIKCKILPPNNMLFPVLPCRTKKLIFPLCRTCMEKLSELCTHNVEERALYGAWTSVEVQKAIELGYEILAVYEIYHFAQKARIFYTYVDTFMNLKQESSGVPKYCLDPNGEVNKEKLDEYVRKYAEHEQVFLEPDKICYNPGQRTVMKALLNSLWGKLAQNGDTTVVSFIDSMDDLLELVNDRSVEVTSLDFISDNVARTTHRKVSSLTSMANRNVIIASFVTAYARLKLFEVLHKLGSNVLYYDTDSALKKSHLTPLMRV